MHKGGGFFEERKKTSHGIRLGKDFVWSKGGSVISDTPIVILLQFLGFVFEVFFFGFFFFFFFCFFK